MYHKVLCEHGQLSEGARKDVVLVVEGDVGGKHGSG